MVMYMNFMKDNCTYMYIFVYILLYNMLTVGAVLLTSVSAYVRCIETAA